MLLIKLKAKLNNTDYPIEKRGRKGTNQARVRDLLFSSLSTSSVADFQQKVAP